MAFKRALETDKRVADENWITTEQLALIGFAARLGTSITNDAEISRDGDVREEAQLLMSLLSSKPPSQSLLCDEEVGWDSPERSATSPAHHTRDSFSFTCPSLSLKPSFSPQTESTPARKYSDSDDSVPSLRASPPTPAELLKRPLKVDDREALRLSAEAMARNVLESFEEALQWRVQTWMNSVAISLVTKEQALLQEEGEETEKESSESKRTIILEELVKSTEAKVIASLQQAAAEIEILDAKTSIRVLDKRIVTPESAPPPKKRRVVKNKEYSVKHEISFQAVLNLLTPAGYTEVMLQTPGTIEGTFLPGLPEEETLTGVVVELDTSTLATTIERSSRIVVRSSAESCVKPSPAPTEEDVPQEQEEQPVQEVQTEELVCMPTPTKSDIQYTDSAGQAAAVVTPRHPSPPSIYCDVETSEKPIRFPIEDSSDEDCRTVSPQPRTDVASYLFTPRNTSIKVPFLVSPSPKTQAKEAVIDTNNGILASSLPTLSPAKNTNKRRPSLPALVEVACAAMRAC